MHEFLGSLDLKSVFWGGWCDIDPNELFFLLLGVFMSVPILEKIAQEIR